MSINIRLRGQNPAQLWVYTPELVDFQYVFDVGEEVRAEARNHLCPSGPGAAFQRTALDEKINCLHNFGLLFDRKSIIMNEEFCRSDADPVEGTRG